MTNHSGAMSALQTHRSSRSQRLLTTLMLLVDDENKVSITSESLRKLMRAQPSTYRAATRELQDEGLLRVSGTGNFAPFTYTLTLPIGAGHNGNTD